MVYIYIFLETKSWERSLILTSRNGRDSEKWVLPEQTLNNKRDCVEVRKTEVVFEVDGVATFWCIIMNTFQCQAQINRVHVVKQ